mgnify:CR=1 FL=1
MKLKTWVFDYRTPAIIKKGIAGLIFFVGFSSILTFISSTHMNSPASFNNSFQFVEILITLLWYTSSGFFILITSFNIATRLKGNINKNKSFDYLVSILVFIAVFFSSAIFLFILYSSINIPIALTVALLSGGCSSGC